MAVVYCNGNIHTLDQRESVVEALVEENGFIVATGSNEEARAVVGRGAREVDLQGLTVVPGLTDSHTHFLVFSLGLERVRLEGVTRLAEALERVREAAGHTPEGRWILGGGFNVDTWEGGRFPTRHDLDSVCAGHPVALTSFDCHTLWVNSLALKTCGITRETRVPEGGRIDTDPDGEPVGIIGENAMKLIERHIPKPTADEAEQAILSGIKVAHRLGLAGVHVMEGSDSLAAFQRLAMRGALSLRVCAFIPAESLEDAVELGVRSGFGGDYLRIGGLKLFTDGSLNSRTADMIEPYEGTDYRGIAAISPEELERVVGRALDSGISVAVHAIGDRANRKTLDVLSRHAARSRELGLRNRIEHAQLLHPDDLRRFSETGTIASVQPVHATSDRYVADRLWGRRSRYAYAFKSLLDSGAVLAFGSDAPVETIDPLRGIYAAVVRKRESEPGSQPWYPEERITIAQAVRAYTTGAAHASYAEGRQGSIERGKVADFAVLSENIFSGEAEKVLSTRIMLNVVGGRAVYEA